MKRFLAVAICGVMCGAVAMAGEPSLRSSPATPPAAPPRARSIEDYRVNFLGMKLPAKWFYRNVGIGRPPASTQQPPAPPRNP